MLVHWGQRTKYGTMNEMPIHSNAVAVILISAALFAASCGTTVDVKPIKVEPIHVTMDVNIRVDRELDQFFAFEEDMGTEIEEPESEETSKPETSS